MHYSPVLWELKMFLLSLLSIWVWRRYNVSNYMQFNILLPCYWVSLSPGAIYASSFPYDTKDSGWISTTINPFPGVPGESSNVQVIWRSVANCFEARKKNVFAFPPHLIVNLICLIQPRHCSRSWIYSIEQNHIPAFK